MFRLGFQIFKSKLKSKSKEREKKSKSIKKKNEEYGEKEKLEWLIFFDATPIASFTWKS